jgi:hypothetical protein
MLKIATKCPKNTEERGPFHTEMINKPRPVLPKSSNKVHLIKKENETW